MDIKTLIEMVSDAQAALDAHGRTGSDASNVFAKLRAAGDVCIDNNDLHSALKEVIPLTSQYAFKQAAFALRNISTLNGGAGGNQTVKGYLHNMKAVYEEILSTNQSNTQQGRSMLTEQSSKVFIVHGHDDRAKIETARFIEAAGLEAIILHEQPSGSKTIIEKIESYGDVGFAVILYTPCDVGSKKSDAIELKERARQNVVFEHGYFIGRLGRSRVAALVKDSVETPNDISGVVYTPIDELGAWKMTLFNELQDAGYEVNTKALR
ncbi:nucleotide-binding protein [Vibrio vulnificus]|nr:nucleotide-binding protein [Vibrio vulnificus]